MDLKLQTKSLLASNKRLTAHSALTGQKPYSIAQNTGFTKTTIFDSRNMKTFEMTANLRTMA